MDSIINGARENDKAIEAMKDLANVEQDANASVLDGITVSYYGVDIPLIQLATISIQKLRVLSIKPFDSKFYFALKAYLKQT